MSNEMSRAVVISGASTGIGAACAMHLDRLGYRIFAGVRKAEDGVALQKSCSERLVPIELDVTDLSTIQKAQTLVSRQTEGRGLFGLVNNAGIAVVGPLEAVPLADLRQQLEVNVIGQVAVTQLFLPLLRQARGRIINMGSIAGLTAMPLMGPYSASKFALEAMTDALRLEVQQWGIHVSIIEPGAIATPIWNKSTIDAAEREVAIKEDLRSLYQPIITAVRKVVAEASKRAISAEIVAKVVEDALTASTPRTRYLVGTDAKLRALMRKLLSDRLSDRLLSWILKLPQ
ncbi:MAG: SDR family oxidoreductase [Nitrospira sp.]|jgi:NAD(P)-dependent dehydrogenase (short-subunit alcohol dehydrogenase family)|nr:SDR family oxidoreductase [Nitrospira sp.]MDH4242375.1 SDR family oxidoreductase [Nitrospira sp.]MDH4355652.1 SDR family oxidoreductase [Nitrospira sp.]MDH5316884.1 SDR family oxidoreductase [Nitrospira sp.]